MALAVCVTQIIWIATLDPKLITLLRIILGIHKSVYHPLINSLLIILPETD